MPASTGMRTRLDPLEECQHRGDVEDRLRDGKLRAGFDLVTEAPDLVIEIERPGIGRHADVESGRLADRLAADVEPVIEPRRHVRQADGVDVEHRRRIRDSPRLAADRP